MQAILDRLDSVVTPALESGTSRLLPLPVSDNILDNGNGAVHFSPTYDGPSSHTYLELMWLVEGEAHINIAGKHFALRTGDFCLLAAGTPHAEIYEARTSSYQSLWFSNRGGRINGLLYAYGPIGRGEIIDHMMTVAPASAESMLFALHDEMRNSEVSERDAICRPLLLAFARLLQRTLLQAHERGELSADDATYRAQIFLEEKYFHSLTLDDVARAAGISPNHLAMVFKRATSKTVIEALTEIRLRHARHMLLERRSSVAQIARACGFGSTEHFSRAFRRAQGMPPSHYGR